MRKEMTADPLTGRSKIHVFCTWAEARQFLEEAPGLEEAAYGSGSDRQGADVILHIDWTPDARRTP